MLTFVQDNASLFGEEFFLSQEICTKKIPTLILSSTYLTPGYNNISEFHYKK